MPRHKTGEAYAVFSCRVPPSLPARLSAHAQLHHRSVRDVVVAALEAYLDGASIVPLDTPATQVVRQAQQRIAEGLKLLGTLHPGRRSVPPQPEKQGRPQETASGENPQIAADFDTSRYYLGALCKRGHDYQGTSQSLRLVRNRSCWACDQEDKRAARIRQKAMRQAA